MNEEKLKKLGITLEHREYTREFENDYLHETRERRFDEYYF